jgi:sterol desaturase/sphingolipid hydroxylase (fatty acid hydroxylase superfamily)
MSTLYVIFYYSTPAVIILASIEAIVLQIVRRGYDWRAYLASLADLLVRQYGVYVYLAFGVADPLIRLAWQHRLMTVPLGTVSSLVLLFLGEEFCYYWFHRASHRMRIFWASHAVHHSPNELNLGASYRFGWTSRFLGAGLFFVPLIWLGFRPEAAFIALNLNLLYQFWLHNDWMPKLGPLEWVLNTPSHHRVHHAANPQYLDRNYGGVLIVFDRLFGTFAEESAAVPCRYGLVEPLRSNNPLWIAFHGWIALGRDLRETGFREWWRALFGPPASHPRTLQAPASKPRISPLEA